MPAVDNGHLPLEAWGNLFLLTSAAAATLVGLLFVVMTLAAERQPASEARRISVYMTPTVVYFASVLLLAAALTIPTQSRLSVALCCCGEGAGGIVYALSLIRLAERFLERKDAWQYALLPAGAFGLQVAGGAIVYVRNPGTGLTMVAVAMLVLLALAVRNSWSIAVNVISSRRREGDSDTKGHG